jgi:hypothetical protein
MFGLALQQRRGQLPTDPKILSCFVSGPCKRPPFAGRRIKVVVSCAFAAPCLSFFFLSSHARTHLSLSLLFLSYLTPCLSISLSLPSSYHVSVSLPLATSMAGTATATATVCSMCGDVGFPEKLFRCARCRHRFQHSYVSLRIPRRRLFSLPACMPLLISLTTVLRYTHMWAGLCHGDAQILHQLLR